MSSGKHKTKHPFNPMQIKGGNIVRLRKDGTIQSVLGKYGDYKKDGTQNQNSSAVRPS